MFFFLFVICFYLILIFLIFIFLFVSYLFLFYYHILLGFTNFLLKYNEDKYFLNYWSINIHRYSFLNIRRGLRSLENVCIIRIRQWMKSYSPSFLKFSPKNSNELLEYIMWTEKNVIRTSKIIFSGTRRTSNNIIVTQRTAIT